ncbi:MAG: TldD/PmbA family protein [Candidatus Delongbacteria bacterium]|nr:TldD/PmbA family protein [Candidatus Delongbacteria bacterium]
MKEQIQKAVDLVAQNCKGDDYRFDIYITDKQDTRYAQNRITQNMGGTKLNVSLEVSFGNRSASSTVNSIDEGSIKNLIETAENIAKMNQPDPEFVNSAGKVDYPEVNNVAAGTENCSMKEMVEVISKFIDNAKRKNAFISGLTTRTVVDEYLFTKNGFEGHDRSTSFSNTMTMSDNKSREVKLTKCVKDFNDFDVDKEIEVLNSRFDALTEPKMIEKGTYNVILRPQAVYNFFAFMMYFFDRRSADYKITPYHEAIGKQIFGEKFSLYSSIDDPSVTASPFSGDGIPAETIDWIRNGVLKNLFKNRSYAKKINENPNFMPNILIEGGDTDEKEMMKMVDNGLIINNFWYIRNVSTRQGEFTGLTRDGMYYFENGEIKHSVVNLRFNEIAIEVTKRILALGKAEPAMSIYGYSTMDNIRVPTMLIKDFTFVDTTTF